MKRKNWDVLAISHQLRAMHSQAVNPYNDGFTASFCKKDLFTLKCLIEDLYANTPAFVNEHEWHEERTLELLKQKT